MSVSCPLYGVKDCARRGAVLKTDVDEHGWLPVSLVDTGVQHIGDIRRRRETTIGRCDGACDLREKGGGGSVMAQIN